MTKTQCSYCGRFVGIDGLIEEEEVLCGKCLNERNESWTKNKKVADDERK